MEEEREIEFRGKSIRSNKWIYGYYQKVNGEIFLGIKRDMHIIKDYNDLWDEIDPKTRGQYIGTKDKNKKKIYEKDIIKHSYPEYDTPKIEIVKWNYNNSSFNISTSKWTEKLGNTIDDSYELLKKVEEKNE